MVISGREGDETITRCKLALRDNGHPLWVNDIRTIKEKERQREWKIEAHGKIGLLFSLPFLPIDLE